MADEEERDKARKTERQMGCNCFHNLKSQVRSWLAGFLTVLKHSLFYDTSETARLDQQTFFSLFRFLIHIHCDLYLHVASGSLQTAGFSAEH